MTTNNLKFLFNIPPCDLEHYDCRTYDRVIGTPQQQRDPGFVMSEERLNAGGWVGLYAKVRPGEEPVLGWHELLSKAKENFRKGKQEWLNAPVEMAKHMLECVPPKLYRGDSFATGEPWNDDARGRAVYLCFMGFHPTRPGGVTKAQYLCLADFVSLITK